jgi:AcrR family transcriptional regulator
MNHPVRTRPDPDEVRARILEVAEQHCRRIGYHKTSVADIASELGMSRANVYRFFPSRDAINESICRRVVSEVADVAIAIARMDAPALEKLDRLLTAVHHHNKTKLIVRAELLGRDGEIDRLQQRVDADRVCDWGDGVQWPNERKPIFFMLCVVG